MFRCFFNGLDIGSEEESITSFQGVSSESFLDDRFRFVEFAVMSGRNLIDIKILHSISRRVVNSANEVGVVGNVNVLSCLQHCSDFRMICDAREESCICVATLSTACTTLVGVHEGVVHRSRPVTDDDDDSGEILRETDVVQE